VTRSRRSNEYVFIPIISARYTQEINAIKRNIKWQIDNAKTIKEEFIGESLIKLLNKIDKNTLATDSFLAGSQYSILARKR